MTDDIEPEQPSIEEIGKVLMSWSHGLDEEGRTIGAMRLSGEFGYLNLHAQDGAGEVERARGRLYKALDQAIDDVCWLDDDVVEERYGEVTPETIMRHLHDDIDPREFGLNFLMWVGEELGVEYTPWDGVEV